MLLQQKPRTQIPPWEFANGFFFEKMRRVNGSFRVSSQGLRKCSCATRNDGALALYSLRLRAVFCCPSKPPVLLSISNPGWTMMSHAVLAPLQSPWELFGKGSCHGIRPRRSIRCLSTPGLCRFKLARAGRGAPDHLPELPGGPARAAAPSERNPGGRDPLRGRSWRRRLNCSTSPSQKPPPLHCLAGNVHRGPRAHIAHEFPASPKASPTITNYFGKGHPTAPPRDTVRGKL